MKVTQYRAKDGKITEVDGIFITIEKLILYLTLFYAAGAVTVFYFFK